MTTTIWTIGYGQRSFDAIERQITDLGISMIIDIRASRGDQRNPNYDYRRLEELAAEAGIGYRWMGSTLGENSPVEIDTAVGNLIALASASPSVVLCREPEPSRCRRSTVIAPALSTHGVSVIHMLPDGTTRPHESSLPFGR